MSEKLENALKDLLQSVDNFEKNFADNQKKALSKPKAPLPQNDLFGLSQEPANKQDNKKMTAVLDRTINRMEKLVGDKG